MCNPTGGLLGAHLDPGTWSLVPNTYSSFCQASFLLSSRNPALGSPCSGSGGTTRPEEIPAEDWCYSLRFAGEFVLRFTESDRFARRTRRVHEVGAQQQGCVPVVDRRGDPAGRDRSRPAAAGGPPLPKASRNRVFKQTHKPCRRLRCQSWCRDGRWGFPSHCYLLFLLGRKRPKARRC